MAKQSITIVLDEKGLETLHDVFGAYEQEPPTPYIRFFAQVEKNSLSLYKDNKLVIQGKDYAEIANEFGVYPQIEKEEKPSFPRYGQIGSDEVGTGDAFGPVIVVGAYVKPSQLKRLKELGVTDSKLLTDDKIREIGPTLINEFDYSSLTLDNAKYNEVHQTHNLNAIKAKMHNRVLGNLLSRHYGATPCVDQFCEPRAYYRYLQGEESVVTDICFSTKGELAFPAVALASVIARYSFLRHMDKLSEELGEKIPFGAGPKVEDFAKKLVKEKGPEALHNIAKTDFKTFRKILG